MLFKTINLLLPVLLPSWRFFKTVAASPRVEVRVTIDGRTSDWACSHPDPDHIGLGAMIARLFWNPQRNNQLYMVSLSERLAEAETKHSTQELARLVGASLSGHEGAFEYRLLFLQRDGSEIIRFLEYQSPLLPIGKGEA